VSEADSPAEEQVAAARLSRPDLRQAAVSLLPAVLLITSALLPWSETELRVLSPVDIPSLGVLAEKSRALFFAPRGLSVSAGQVALRFEYQWHFVLHQELQMNSSGFFPS